ncbi:hypothetical protein N8T08_007098 [Aspergillus melleus]|uniref:Uncharacterized protein n=1 Tax=Aspergillus melleus TaxID=138277 RepID=A0ACC3AYP4_9EURO|nr:hypothetical protein N8T08_007098 [Aspergillus melleus]
MGKPRMIILVRHAQSEGNKNREIHQSIPDHRVKLTAEGHRQAQEAGTHLRSLLRPDDTIHFFTSPYRRTRETTEGILQSLSSDSPSPTPFPRHTIKVYEEPRLREQDFGNFQPCSAEMERMWLERADYGHFFYRIPNGESAADAYDRVSGFNESLWRLFGEDDFASVCVLVTHGLMTRIFLMKWYHWSVEYFEDLRNINHCEFVVMKLNPDNGKYVLQNQLRTWSELRKEKEAERQQERTAKGLGPTIPLTPSDHSVPIRRTWGGCPDGCNHGVRRKGSVRSSRPNAPDPHKRQNETSRGGATTQENKVDHHQEPSCTVSAKSTNQVEQRTLTAPEPGLGDRSTEAKPVEKTIPSPPRRHDFHRQDTSVTTHVSHVRMLSNDGADGTENDNTSTNSNCNDTPSSAIPPSSGPCPSPIPKRPGLVHFHRDSEDHLLHPPRSNYGLFHLGGRDGGGSLSGANSLAPSEDEHETKKRAVRRPLQHQPKSSQDFGNDGDDEGSGQHQKRHLAQQVAINLTERGQNDHDYDGNDDSSIQSQNESQLQHGYQHDDYDHDHDHDHDHNGNRTDDIGDDSTFEAQRREDQSIRGSVY